MESGSLRVMARFWTRTSAFFSRERVRAALWVRMKMVPRNAIIRTTIVMKGIISRAAIPKRRNRVRDSMASDSSLELPGLLQVRPVSEHHRLAPPDHGGIDGVEALVVPGAEGQPELRPESDVQVPYGFDGLDQLLTGQVPAGPLEPLHQHHGVHESLQAHVGGLGLREGLLQDLVVERDGRRSEEHTSELQ